LPTVTVKIINIPARRLMLAANGKKYKNSRILKTRKVIAIGKTRRFVKAD
jgi:hypothetical protein